MNKRFAFTVCLLLAGCGGPASVVPYVMSACLTAYDSNQRKEQNLHKRYIAKCLPTKRKIHAFNAGIMAERDALHIQASSQPDKATKSQARLVDAYVYYTIAETLGEPRARSKIETVLGYMQAATKQQAKEEFEKYTLENLVSCYQ